MKAYIMHELLYVSKMIHLNKEIKRDRERDFIALDLNDFPGDFPFIIYA